MEISNTPNLILSSYFFQVFHHPEKEIYIPKDDFNVIKNLYTKISETWKNEVDVRIFHDGLSSEFIERYSKKWLKFIYIDTSEYDISPRDIRLHVAAEFMRQNPQWEKVFIVDSLTVKCISNPFNALQHNINSLFIASEKKKLVSYSMFRSKLEKIGIEIEYEHYEELKNRLTLNSDIMGGHRNTLIPFIEKYCYLFEKLHDTFVKHNNGGFSIRNNMIAINYVSLFYDNILTERPLHITNRKYQMTGNSDGILMFTFN